MPNKECDYCDKCWNVGDDAIGACLDKDCPCHSLKRSYRKVGKWIVCLLCQPSKKNQSVKLY